MKYVRSLIAALLFAFAFGVVAAAPASAEYVEPTPPQPPVEYDAPNNDPFDDGCVPAPGMSDVCVDSGGGGVPHDSSDELWVPPAPPELVDDYSEDPYQQGNAPTGGGSNVQYLDMVSLNYHEYVVEQRDEQLSALRVTTIVSLLLALVSAGFALWSIYDLRRVRSKTVSRPVDPVKPTLAKQYKPASKVSPANYNKK